jgi:hypothetical protein
MDIRARCLPNNKRDIDSWKFCRAKTDTAYWLIGNERDIYEAKDKYGFRSKLFKNIVCDAFKLDDKDWKGMLVIYDEDEDK